jgi:uncharacterized pyridoxamine 5'-phosphate oxidase family protein
MFSSLLSGLASSSCPSESEAPKIRRGKPLKIKTEYKNPCIEECDEGLYRYIVFQYEDGALEVSASNSVDPTVGFTTTLESGQISVSDLLTGLREGKNVFVVSDNSRPTFKVTKDKMVEAKELTAVDAVATMSIFHERTRTDVERRRKVKVMLKKMKELKKLVGDATKSSAPPTPKRGSSSSSKKERSRRRRDKSESDEESPRKKHRGSRRSRHSRRERSPSSASSSSSSSASSTSDSEAEQPTSKTRKSSRPATSSASCSFSCGPRASCRNPSGAAATEDKKKSKDKPKPADDDDEEITIPLQGAGGADFLRMLLSGGLGGGGMFPRPGQRGADRDMPEMEEVD